MKAPIKTIAVLLVVLAAGAFIITKVFVSKPAATQKWSPSPAQPEHSREDYSPVSIARDQCRKLTNAIREFQSKRGHLPLPAGSATDEKQTYPIDGAMLAALTGKDREANTAGVDYLAAAGITAPLTKWQFFAAFDFNGDGAIPDPSAPDQMVSQDILVWTAGEDEKPETWTDNACAWIRN